MLARVNVLWKKEGDKVYIASGKGNYLLNQKASFIWDLIGKEEEDKIIRLYEEKFGVKEKGEVSRFIDNLKALGLVEV
jgi:hypothetical protein